jgi:hypothetical protein
MHTASVQRTYWHPRCLFNYVAISTSSIVVAVKHQVSCDLSDEVVILNLQDSVYYGLNAVAARVWNLIQEPCAVEEIRRSLVEEYEVDPHDCELQVQELLNDLAGRGLIEVRT